MPEVSVKQLNQAHPEHQLYSEAWMNFDLLACGGVMLQQAAQNFLVRAPKELLDVYGERIRRLTYQNILGTVVGWYISQLWRRNPQILIKPEQADPWYEKFLEDCDGGGTTYNDFFRKVFRSWCLSGRAWVLTDRPPAMAPPETRADEQAQGLDRPYLVHYEPSKVINWSEDAAGNLNWAVVKCIEDNPEFLKRSERVIRWYYFDRQEYRVYEYKGDEKRVNVTAGSEMQIWQTRIYDAAGKQINDEQAFATLVDEGPHALAKEGRVPLRRFEVPDELWLANRAYLQLVDHLNQENTLAWGLFMGNVPMPVVFSEREPGPMTISQVGYLLFGKDDRFEWAAPPAESYEISQKRLQYLREEIYRSFYLQAQGRSSSASASQASGYSKEIDMMPANEILNGYGDRIIRAMQDVFSDVVAARGDTYSAMAKKKVVPLKMAA